MKEYFSKRLEKAMKSKNLSSYRIAKEMGISPSTVANYLNGATTPSSSKLNDLSIFLKVNRDWLEFGEGEMENKATQDIESKLSNIKSRVLHIAEYKGLAKSKFCEEIGLTYGNFTGKAKSTPLNSSTISNILTQVPEINPMWLITGKGEMLKYNADSQEIQNRESGENISPIKERILQYIGYKGIKKVDFYEKIRLNPSNFKGAGLKSDLSGNKISNILSLYPEINPSWLIMGEGPMLKNDTENQDAQNMNSAISRMIEYLESKDFSKYSFYKETKLSNGFLDKNRNIGSDKCEIISSHYPDLNLSWLITGRGNMLNQDAENSIQESPPQEKECPQCKEKDKIIKEMGERINELQRDKERLWRIVEAGAAKKRIKDNKAD